MTQAGVSASMPRSRRRVQAWLDWSEDELWVAPRPRESVAMGRRAVAPDGRTVASERRPVASVRGPRVATGRVTEAPARVIEPPGQPAQRPRQVAQPPRAVAERPQRASASPVAPAGRRTITITGHGDDRQTGRAELTGRPRPQRRAHERPGYRPDRLALYAVLLGVVLVLVAATSSHAATLRPAHARPAAQVRLVQAPVHAVATARH
jgi:hypothetical protein